ncbi:DUF2325 domain-containing protein [Thiocystis violascens]|uniref:DUF2325 domain-containing protein n=1 Tax=Thiocystis violascens (strain ATCC 17096 / DSM 198 / 6111) TaxID=765911 RepID=I3Y8J4_THIV6|nr:DUF2325 domain-containing protein [Thiocystis violascens]AFL73312.1 hypothetical protein Thivi_1292 [Thiocystis violascens DSM 198]
MLERFILEVADPPGRMSLYDYESRALLNEISGRDWGTMLQRLTDFADAETDGSEQVARFDAPGGDSRLSIGATVEDPAVALTTLLAAGRGLTPATPTETASPGQKRSRRKLWEVPHKYHCPIIGTCLEVADLRRIGARFAWRNKERPSEYEIHVSFVGAADDRNALSQATHKLLEKRYAGVVRRFAKARSPEELLALWAEALGSGQVPAALWAIMTHPKADAAVMALAYEDVHMLSHQIGAGQRADLKALAETGQELARLKREFDALQRRTREQTDTREREFASLTARLERSEEERDRMREREQKLSERLKANGAEAHWEAIGDRDARVAWLEETLADSESRTAAWREKHGLAQAECERLARLARERTADCEALDRLFFQSSTASCGDCPNEDCAQRADLGGRLVLCVGGRKPLVEQYRRLVTGCNGRFDHHDGGLEDNQRRLEAMLASADAVVCAADYVSHDAYYRTKRFCKRLEKPHVLLGSSGVSAFARALEQVAG